MSEEGSRTSSVPADEERGWEDWDEDQRRALGKSHKRTMGSLEERSSMGSRSSIMDVRPQPNLRDPKDQILPSDQELSKQEEKAKERTVDNPVAKNQRKFFTRTCIVVAAVALVCVSGLVAVTFLIPITGGPGAANVLGGKQGQPPKGEPARATQQGGESVADMAKSVTNWFRNAAFYVGNELKPQHPKQKEVTFMFPDYAFTGNADEEDDVNGWKEPRYEGLYSKVEEPVVDVQPVLWVTQRSGAKTLKEILTYCARLVESCDSADGHESSDLLEIFSSPDNAGHYANVNSETVKGLARADKLGVVDSELVHVLSTPLLPNASQLFDNKFRTGRIFGLLRDPIDQALSDYNMRKALPTGHDYRLPEDLTLAQFIESSRFVSNPLTKALANVTDGTIITEVHIYAAKKMLHERVLVGLLTSFDESVHRFVEYFGWTIHDPLCATNFEIARDHRDDHETLPDSSQERSALQDRNWADIEVYEFAKTIVFPNQKSVNKMVV